MHSSDDVKKKVISSLIYRYIERSGHQLITFIIQLILARLLSPSDYGIIALLLVFINISQVFVQSGLNTALIQNKDVNDTDYSSVFFVSLGISLALYLLLFFSAPLIVTFFQMPELSATLRVLAIILIPGAVNSIQSAKLVREMQFKKQMYSTLGAATISGAVGIFMAHQGYGIWALVGQQLVNQIVICVILWFVVKWRPMAKIDFVRLNVLFSFGWKLLCSGLIDTVYRNLRSLVIGRQFDAGSLGYYNRGMQFPQLIISNINASIQTVMLPTLSRQQDDKARMKAMVRRSIVTSSFIIFPLMVGLAVVAEPLVSLILTDIWLPAVPFLQVYCFIFAFFPIHTANLQSLNAQGRSDKFLKLEIIKISYGITILLFTILFFDSPIAIALGGAVTSLISCFVNASPNKKLLNYGYLEQMKDILPSLALALIMGACVYMISWLRLSSIPTLIIQVITGVFVYTALAWVFRLESFLYLKDTIKNYLPERIK